MQSVYTHHENQVSLLNFTTLLFPALLTGLNGKTSLGVNSIPDISFFVVKEVLLRSGDPTLNLKQQLQRLSKVLKIKSISPVHGELRQVVDVLVVNVFLLSTKQTHFSGLVKKILSANNAQNFLLSKITF